MRRGNQHGFVAGMDIAIVGLVMIVAFVLLFINLWLVITAKFALDSAARNAARTLAEAQGHGAQEAAHARAIQTLAAWNVETDNVAVFVPSTNSRCAQFEVTLTRSMRLIRIPFSMGITEVSLTSTHRDRVDAYRSGFANGTC